MSPEIQAKMNDLCFKMNEAANEFKLDPSTDAQFCAGTISQAIAGMNMRLGNQWGKKMVPVALVEPIRSEEIAELSEAFTNIGKLEPVEASPVKAKPKAKKK